MRGPWGPTYPSCSLSVLLFSRKRSMQFAESDPANRRHVALTVRRCGCDAGAWQVVRSTQERGTEGSGSSLSRLQIRQQIAHLIVRHRIG
jgi:hypothetical protein